MLKLARRPRCVDSRLVVQVTVFLGVHYRASEKTLSHSLDVV